MSDHEYGNLREQQYRGPPIATLPEGIQHIISSTLTLLAEKQGIILLVSRRQSNLPEHLATRTEIFQTDMGFFSAYYIHDGVHLYSVQLKTPGGSDTVDRDVGKLLGFEPKKMVIVDRPSPGMLLFCRED